MILLHGHPLSSPLNQLVGLLIIAAGLSYAYAYLDLHRHGALASLWQRGLIRSSHIALFAAGLLILIVALMSPLDELADLRFSAHMIQHILITMVASPLMLFGTPSPLARAALSRPRLRAFVAQLTDPAIAFSAFFLNLYVWHIPELYELALQNDFVHALQHALYFYTGLLFWWRIIDPTHGWFPLFDWPPAKWVYLLIAAPASYVLGTLLWASGSIIYPTYAQVGGIGALADQRMGGAFMWIQGWMFLMASMLVFFRGYHPGGEQV